MASAAVVRSTRPADICQDRRTVVAVLAVLPPSASANFLVETGDLAFAWSAIERSLPVSSLVVGVVGDDQLVSLGRCAGGYLSKLSCACGTHCPAAMGTPDAAERARRTA